MPPPYGVKDGGHAPGIERGSGKDILNYDSAGQSNLANADTITDFEAGTDLIDLTGIDAITRVTGNDAFAFIGGAAFSRTAGELRLDTSSAGRTTLQADTNGDAKADLVIYLT